MAAKRKPSSHETGEAKMKAAALKAVKKGDVAQPVPSPAKELQEQLQSHYQPLSKRFSVLLISMLMTFAFIGGWLGGSGAINLA